MRLHFDAPRRRRWGWWVLALLAVLAAWVVVASRKERGSMAVQPEAPVVSTSAGAAASAGARSPPASTVVTAPPAPKRAAASPAPSGESIEVCGRGRMTVADAERVLGPENAAARREMAAALLQGSEREQVLGLLLTSQAAGLDALYREPQECTGPAAACAQAAWQRQVAATTPTTDALVKLALASSDPGVYAAAFVQGCSGGARMAGGSPASCTRLSAREWQRRDPGDAAAALWVAQQAAQRGDTDALDAALTAALVAPRWSSPPDLLLGALIAHPRFVALAPPQQAEVLALAIGLGLANAGSIGQMLHQQVCSPQALADPPRRARCEALVGRVIADSPSLLEFGLATRWAERLGWSPERVRALEAEKLALMQVQTALIPPEQLLSCDGVRRVVKMAAARALHGETGAARRDIEASGRPIAAWAAEARADAAKRDAAFLGASAAQR